MVLVTLLMPRVTCWKARAMLMEVLALCWD